MKELRTVLHDHLESLVLKGVTICHIEVLEIKLAGMHWFWLHCPLLRQVDTSNLMTACDIKVLEVDALGNQLEDAYVGYVDAAFYFQMAQLRTSPTNQ